MNPSSFFPRLACVIWSPARAFHALREKPTWLGAFLVIGLGSSGLTWLTVPTVQRIAMSALSPSLAAPQIQQLVHINHLAHWAATVAAFLSTPVSWFISAFLLWLMAQVFDGLPSFKCIFAVVAHANLVSLISGCLVAVLLLLKSHGDAPDLQDLDIRLGLDLFWPGELHPAQRVALASLNPFNLWYYGLLVVGTAAACRFSAFRATGVIGSFWALNLAFGAGFAWVVGSLTATTPT